MLHLRISRYILICIVISFAAFCGTVFSSCSLYDFSAEGNSAATIPYGGSLTVVPTPRGEVQRNFNPFVDEHLSQTGTRGLIYETLLYFNRLTHTVHPWLANSYHWSPDLLHLTFSLRPGVSWSDGQPLTSRDVAYTFNLLRRYPALDGNNIWSIISAVSTPDSSQVVITFRTANTSSLWLLGGQLYIAPFHIWCHVKNPVADPNISPVGSGPFHLASFDPALYVLQRNPHFWQPGKPYISQLRFPSYTSNVSADLLLGQGAIDWLGIYGKNVEQEYVQQDPHHNRYWFVPTTPVNLYLNLKRSPFNDVRVRRALSFALDRSRLSNEAESGYDQLAHPTGLILPGDQKFLDPRYRSLSYAYDATKANQLLDQAGYLRSASGIRLDPHTGKPFSFTLHVVLGWTDWEVMSNIIRTELAQIGVQVSLVERAQTAFVTDLESSNYDMAIGWSSVGPSPGPTPYYFYNWLLGSSYTSTGQGMQSNWEHWHDVTTNQFLHQYSRSLDSRQQLQALYGLQQIMVEQLPVIPLVYNSDWYESTCARFTGWPDPQHPYAIPSPSIYPDIEQVVLHLHLTTSMKGMS